VFVVCGSQGGPLAFPRLKTGDSIEAWCKEVVQGCGVLLLPASVYDHAASTERGHFRYCKHDSGIALHFGSVARP
jgi:aspartate/methionine/tyrosine aminotransferase